MRVLLTATPTFTAKLAVSHTDERAFVVRIKSHNCRNVNANYADKYKYVYANAFGKPHSNPTPLKTPRHSIEETFAFISIFYV